MFLCATAEYVALALGTSLLFLFLLVTTVAHVRSARSAAADERERVAAEAEAFAAFARQVADLEAGPAGSGTRSVGAATLVESATATSMDEVEEAYRSTVMAVPHYEAEYDEPLAQHMATEFGDDVASAVAAGGALTPQLKQTLLQRSGRSHRLRVALLEHLDAEVEELAAAQAEYDRIAESVARIDAEPLEDASFEELLAEWFLLEDRERECVDRLERRQETVQSRQGLVKHVSDAPTLEEYLYSQLDVTYPVLADGTDLLERVQGARSQVLLALASFGHG